MCPDPQILSIYVDGELPSPWKEKMESHLKKCPDCMEKYGNFKHLHELFKKDTTIRRRYIERIVDGPAEEPTYTEDELRTSKDRVWDKIEAKQKATDRSRAAGSSHVWKRRLSIPLPAAAAAAVVIALVTYLFISGQTFFQNGIAGKKADTNEKVNFILAADEEMPDIIPASNIDGVLQYLNSDGAEIIILKLPESRNFSRTGEPAIIRAADYQKNESQRNDTPRRSSLK
jgi:hypothetical protein